MSESLSAGIWSFLWKRHTDIYNITELDKVRHICYNTTIMTKDFLETVIEEQKILDIGLKQSKANKKERLEKEKTVSEQLQDELEPIDND